MHPEGSPSRCGKSIAKKTCCHTFSPVWGEACCTSTVFGLAAVEVAGACCTAAVTGVASGDGILEAALLVIRREGAACCAAGMCPNAAGERVSTAQGLAGIRL